MNGGMTSLGGTIPTTATLLLLALSVMGQMIQGRKLSLERQFHAYKAMLKSENRTAFPDRDIRSLLNPGLRSRDPVLLTPSQAHRQRTRPQSGGGNNDHLSQLPTVATAVNNNNMGSPFPAKSFGPSRRHRKKWNKKRKQRKTAATDKPSRLTEDSNELEADNLDKLFPHGQNSAIPKRHSGRRKERRRKNRRRRLHQRKIKSSKTSVVVTHISNLPPLKERCKTRPMKQQIKVKGCITKTITNNFCYGQCNSYFIPETQGRGDGPPAFVSCGFCRPKTIRPIIVQLQCTNRNGRTRWKRKKVPYIKKCRCMAQQVKLDFL